VAFLVPPGEDGHESDNDERDGDDSGADASDSDTSTLGTPHENNAPGALPHRFANQFRHRLAVATVRTITRDKYSDDLVAMTTTGKWGNHFRVYGGSEGTPDPDLASALDDTASIDAAATAPRPTDANATWIRSLAVIQPVKASQHMKRWLTDSKGPCWLNRRCCNAKRQWSAMHDGTEPSQGYLNDAEWAALRKRQRIAACTFYSKIDAELQQRAVAVHEMVGKTLVGVSDLSSGASAVAVDRAPADIMYDTLEAIEEWTSKASTAKRTKERKAELRKIPGKRGMIDTTRKKTPVDLVRATSSNAPMYMSSPQRLQATCYSQWTKNKAPASSPRASKTPPRYFTHIPHMCIRTPTIAYVRINRPGTLRGKPAQAAVRGTASKETQSARKRLGTPKKARPLSVVAKR
jgi:hypothetical protein